MPILSRLSRRRRSVTSVGTVSVFSTALFALAITNPGLPAADVEVNDSGIWVTRSDRAMVGRFNHEAQVIDGAVTASSPSFEVLQQDELVLIHDLDANSVSVVDVAGLEVSGSANLPEDGRVGLGGESVAILDTAEGALWVMPVAELASFSAADTEPLDIDVPSDGALVVGVDGTVHVATAEDATIRSISTSAGRPLEVRERTLSDVAEGDELAITTVGGTPVVLDRETAELHLPGGRVSVRDPDVVRLQRPGPDGPAVIYLDEQSLVTQPLSGGEAVPFAGGGTDAAAPVVVRGCSYGAWASTGTVVRDCPGERDDKVETVPVPSGGWLRFRVNRGAVVLNELLTGSVWLADQDFEHLEAWQDVLPTDTGADAEEATTTEQSRDPLEDRDLPNRPPDARDDAFGARPGRTTILPILDNDSDPDGDVLTASLAGAGPSIGTLEMIYGGKGMQVTLPADAPVGPTSFEYEANDGRGGTDRAAVRLTVRAEDANGPPAPVRDTVVVVEQGRSAEVDVLADWLDPDGDPLLLVAASATTEGDEVRFRPDGVVTFQDAGTSQGRKQVRLSVSDGVGEPVDGVLWVDVRPTGQLPPEARADHETTIAGRPVVVFPLSNDRDANGDQLRLARVDEVSGATVTPDYAAGTITFVAETPGTYQFTYRVTDGPHSVLGLVRVDVLAESPSEQAPVAVRDRALLPVDGSVLVDVLANDWDPAGGVLVVQSVRIPPQAGVSIAILNHQILRISAVRAVTETVRIGYTVSNGLSSATGEVLVVPLPAPDRIQPPVAVADEVSVRTGDVVTIRVLENDTHPNGAPISLVRALVEEPDPADGLIFTTDDAIRFRAGPEAKTVYATYEIADPAGNRDAAQVRIHIRAADAEHNAAPQPRNLTVRVLAGATVRVAVPLDGIDPDGDSVTLLGLDDAPSKGRIVDFGEGWLDYEAARGSAGTDTFTYAVRDAFGAQATATIVVGIAPPAQVNSPPIALDDRITARPGREVAVPVMVNDVDPEGGALRLVSGALEGDAELDPEVRLDRVVVRTPVDPGTYTVRYTIQDDLASRASAALVIEVTTDAPLRAPVARDDLLTLSDVLGLTAVDVPVLQNDDDPDGSTADLSVGVEGSSGRVPGDGKVRVTVAETAQVIAYTVTDVDGLIATAFIRIPGTGYLRPTLKPGLDPLEVVSGQSITVNVADYVIVADGRRVSLTERERVRAMHGVVDVENATTITFTAREDYSGSAALTFEVTDGDGPDDPAGRKAVLSLPITVLPGSNQAPEFTAPELQVAAGEESRVDLAAHASDPDPADADRLRFSVVGEVPDGYTARVDGTELVVSVEAGVPTGSTASIALEVTDGTTDPVRRSATVLVVGSTAPLATVNDETVSDAHQGVTVTVPVLANDVSPFPGEPLRLVSATVESGSGRAAVEGSAVEITPAEDFVGTMTVRYRVGDATRDAAREVDGRVRLTVKGRPDAPLTPTVVEVRSRTVVLTWAPPVNNGAAITHYSVRSANGYAKQCPATTCTLDGLQNDVEYTFIVTAANEVGDSPPSPASSPVRPDERPDAPAPPSLQFGDRSLTVTWQNRAYSDRSPITSVNLEISPAPPSGAVQKAGVTGTTFVWDGLENGTSYRVRVQAVNRAPEPSDWGAYSAAEVPAGVPDVPAAPTTGTPTALGSQAQLAVSWDAPANNGDAIASYTLTVLRGGSVLRLVDGIAGGQTSQTVTVDTSETAYTFTVAARNKAGSSAASPPSAPRRGVVAPGPVSGLSATPQDNAVQLAFGAAAGNGASASEVRYQYSVNGGAWNDLAGDRRITWGVGNNGTYTASVRAVSTVDGAEYAGPAASANAVAPFGPPGVPYANASQGFTTVRLCWAPPGRNGRDFRLDISIDGGGWENVGSNSNCRDVGNGHSQTHSIAVRTVDTEGQVSATASASARSQDPPQPTASVSRGEVYNPTGCTAGTCRRVMLNVSNFPAGTYQVKCWASDGGDGVYWTQNGLTVPANGTVGTACAYGIPGQDVWLEVVGVITTARFRW